MLIRFFSTLIVIFFLAGCAGQPQVSRAYPLGENFTFEIAEHQYIEMIWVPAGSFLMGTPEGKPTRHDDELQHRVEITQGYWLASKELTQKQWLETMGSTLVEQQNKQDKHWRLRGTGDNLPMYFISWDESIELTEKLNQQFAFKIPQGYRFSLPTEAQWEMAAQVYENKSVPLTERAWFKDNSYKRVHRVGSKTPNLLGIYDLKGNLSEWCYDWHGLFSQQDLTVDPQGPKTGMLKVVKGGSWFGPAINTNTGTRFKDPKQKGYSSMALRLALRPMD